MARRSYHHGDLRRALLTAAAAFLRDGDVTALTMQTLAKAAGVSPAAPYHHFEDKPALLAALAEEGFDQLFERLTAATASPAAAADKLVALARAYFEFAAARPAHYRIMFLPEIRDRARFASLHASAGRSMQLLVGILVTGLSGVSEPEIAARAVAAWSACHGFVALRMAGVLSNMPGLPDLATLERFTSAQMTLAALADRPKSSN
ncbi:TetR/AcrR family transcriptional regulator [Nannocystis radixulma]|uniref:TetR/AcrR family transcriptional regulator n=1 Tax=Nannocystis radixulma TaxID=2995305 RepID=A0ABT5BDR0_9BACT|nr:TetR/AcrR family transcriptional regulator [Nannocystis radixulma]MDC0672271.1 TetR/AcrR family transcriptional regulator [Nannocystis radixulma]